MELTATRTAEPRRSACGGRAMEYSVHGLVSIRLQNAPSSVLDALVQELGPSQGPPVAEPDIIVTFTERLPRPSTLRFLERNQAAYDEQSFYLLDEAGRRVQIALDALGDRCELVCEAGVRSIPLLAPMVGLRLLRKGYVLLHSSAFVYRGKGILVTGWQKGGKTEMLLPFMAAGARYVADEWTIVGGERPALYGMSGTTKMWDWHFQELPQYWRRISCGSRVRLRGLLLYQRLYRALPVALRAHGRPLEALRALGRPASSRFGLARSSPEALFPGRVWAGPAPLDRVFLAVLAPPPTRVAPLEPRDVARRVVSSLAYERSRLMNAYDQYRFAFPDRSNKLIETARERELALLGAAFAGKPAFEIQHPYPVHLAELYHAAAPYCL